jgi:hypothetical protein
MQDNQYNEIPQLSDDDKREIYQYAIKRSEQIIREMGDDDERLSRY